jgi:hypothetical protein
MCIPSKLFQTEFNPLLPNPITNPTTTNTKGTSDLQEEEKKKVPTQYCDRLCGKIHTLIIQKPVLSSKHWYMTLDAIC